VQHVICNAVLACLGGVCKSLVALFLSSSGFALSASHHKCYHILVPGYLQVISSAVITLVWYYLLQVICGTTFLQFSGLSG